MRRGSIRTQDPDAHQVELGASVAVALAHKMIRLIYLLLSREQPSYIDQGVDHAFMNAVMSAEENAPR
jgi:hypothetical protein